MKQIINAIRELRTSVFAIRLFESLLDSLIVYLACLLIVSLTNIEWYFALIPSVIYLILHTLNSMKGVSFTEVEEKVPILYESLRTAADSAKQENIIVNELHQEVLAKMKEIRTSYFLGFGKTTRQLVLLTAIAFGIIFASAFDIRLLDAPAMAFELGNLRPFQKYATTPQELLKGPADADIFGDESIAELGTKEVKLEIHPLMSEINLQDTKPPEEKEFVDSFPRDIEASQDASYDEKIAKEHQQIVKNYFTGITK